MGYCHRCQHDCTEKDPCPCCRRKHPIPWYNPPEVTPHHYTTPYKIITTPDLKPRTRQVSRILTGAR